MASVPSSPTPVTRPAAAGASLVIAPQWIGDAVMTEPLMRRLHARGERLTVGALPWVAPVYRAMPQVAEVIEFPFAHGGLQFKARRSLARELAGRFDSAYVLPNSLKSALLPFLASIPRRVGYLGEARVGLLTHRLKNPAGKPPMVAFYSALSGEPGVAQDRPRLQLADAAVDSVLAAHGLARGGYTVMAPGAEFGPAKRWPTRHFARLAALLGRTVVLLGSAKEASLCAEIAEAMEVGQDARADGGADGGAQADVPVGVDTGVHAGAQAAARGDVEQVASGPAALPVAAPRLVDLSGRTSLADALALIAGAGHVVSNDSGLMHVAAAFGVPQAAVFGSSSPHHTPPLNDRARVLWLKDDPGYQPPLDCAPCFERECPLGHTRCLNDLSPERVRDALRA